MYSCRARCARMIDDQLPARWVYSTRFILRQQSTYWPRAYKWTAPDINIGPLTLPSPRRLARHAFQLVENTSRHQSCCKFSLRERWVGLPARANGRWLGIQLEMFTGPNRAYNVYAGFLMANDCKLISQNDATQDKDALCGGGYYKGASVTCDSNHLPVAAVDTHNQHWRCSPTTDSGCNVGGSGGRFYVQACCDRA
ncbi:hypothetical protein BOTBODRAFT_71124 [Botryobasidium botryosum FD-172 SS1]|uniref:Uncharacterized protein n=1 Tax=Botryobasidium botryosum (strain FD-172 SS1) TaxID=930990 RepID=A0A067LSL6_BOTB1|nr:hypothetical protein BOTBODRAFT_71124 [Botryobasidium botryosum FD-172 SS1]